jgi:hypothetical protein
MQVVLDFPADFVAEPHHFFNKDPDTSKIFNEAPATVRASATTLRYNKSNFF